MHRVSTYRLILIAILVAGIAAETRTSTARTQAHLRLTGVLTRFPKRIEAFEGTDDQSVYARFVRQSYWPAQIVDRIYTRGSEDPIQVFISPDWVGRHAQDICTLYSGWKIVQQTTAELRGVPQVNLTRSVEASPRTPGYDAAIMVCNQYWREDEKGFSEEDVNHLLLRHGFCFRVLTCTEIPSLGAAPDGFARLDNFAAHADPLVCQFLKKAEAE